LREVAERQPLGSQLVLEGRPEDAGLDVRRPGDPIDLEDLIEPFEVEADRGAAWRGDAADDRGAATPGHHRDARVAAPVEHRRDLVRGARAHHQVGDLGDVPVERPDHVPEGVAVSVPEPIDRVLAPEPARAAGRSIRGVGTSTVRGSAGSAGAVIPPPKRSAMSWPTPSSA
jgi:hypothetical protein